MLLHGKILQGVHGLLMWGAFATNGHVCVADMFISTLCGIRVS